MKTKRKSFFKSVIALTLALIMVLGAAPLSELAGVDWASFFAPKAEAAGKTDIIDYEVLKAQYIAGTKDYPESATVTGNTANDIYNYYIRDDIYSPSLDMLNSVREDKALKAEMVAWEMYSLGGSPSSAIDKIMKGEDYCETLLLSALEKSLEDNNWTKALKSEVAGETKDLRDMFYDLCDVGDEITTAEDAKKAEEGLKQAVKKLYPDKTEKITGAIGYIIKYTKRITEIIQKVVAYSKLLDIDEYSKEWLAEMRLMNEQTVNDSDMRAALDRLIGASMNEDNFANVSLMLGVETTAKWILETGIKEGIKALCKGNPVVAAIFTGLSVVKTICNIFFATDDVCEQLYVMNKLETLQLLARGVARKAESNFVNTENNYYAQIFTKSVDLYFNLITEVDCDCMKEFLKNLYTGGYLKGVLVWLYNAKGDYESAVETLDSFQQTRRNNYNYMIKYCMIGLKLTSEQSYNYYFGNEAVEMTNDAWVISSPYFTLAFRDGSQKYIEITGLKDKSLSYINIPSKIGKYPVQLSIPEQYPFQGLFENNTNIIEVSIGDNVHITDRTFYGCTNLKKVNLGKEVGVGRYAFSDCVNLETISGSVYGYIGDGAFLNCPNLRKISCSCVNFVGDEAFKNTPISGVAGSEYIGSEAFIDTNIYSAILTDTVVLGTRAFKGSLVEEIYIGEKLEYIPAEAFTYCPIRNLDIPDNIKRIDRSAFSGCGSLKEINLGNGVTEIGDYVFESCRGLTSVTIPDSVTTIGDDAFSDCTGLTSVTIGNGVTTIGDNAFRGCTGLTNVTIPDSVEFLGSGVFSRCTSLTSITVDKNNENYSSRDGVLFNMDQTTLIQYPVGNQRDTYIIPDSVTNIEYNAFYDCTGLTSITIPDSVTNIKDNTFSDCTGLTSITVDKNNENYSSRDGVLFNKDQTTLIQYPAGNQRDTYIIPDSVTSIGGSAFSDCTGLTSITIPGSVTSIEEHAFYGCTGLTSITIPDSVTNIGSAAFYGCKGLTDVYYSGTEAEWKKIAIGAFNDELKNATIHYNANPCTNHSWSEWTVIQPATAEAEGLRERTCTVCGEKETEAIPKLDFTYGDVNGDGKINGRDAIKLAKYLAAYDEDKGESSVAVSPGADVNGDGKINGRDLVKLRKYLANYDESTGESSVKLGPGN